jgi:2-iminobutanoate/2-iminopropanoate deaminase
MKPSLREGHPVWADYSKALLHRFAYAQMPFNFNVIDSCHLEDQMDFYATDGAPKAIGPYSQAVRSGSLIFTSGQTPIDPATGQLVEGDFEAMVRRVFENLRAVLEAAGTDFRSVIKATVFLTDLANFQRMNAIYGEIFGEHRPARSTIGVSQLPMGAPVEIELIAISQ